jgi:hypothetical protein
MKRVYDRYVARRKRKAAENLARAQTATTSDARCLIGSTLAPTTPDRLAL